MEDDLRRDRDDGRAASAASIDEPPPDDAARLTLRQQALGWLKAELALWTKLVEAGPPQAKAFIACQCGSGR